MSYLLLLTSIPVIYSQLYLYSILKNATQQLGREILYLLGETSQDSAHRPLKCRLVLMEMRKVNVIGHWIGHLDSLHLLYLMKVYCHTTF